MELLQIPVDLLNQVEAILAEARRIKTNQRGFQGWTPAMLGDTHDSVKRLIRNR